MRRPSSRPLRRFRRRTLHVEPLERREMLSVTLWGSSETAPPTSTLEYLSEESSDSSDGVLQFDDLAESSTQASTAEDATYTVAEIDAIATDFGSTDYHEEVFEELELRTVWYKVRAIRDGLFSVQTSGFCYPEYVGYQPPAAAKVDQISDVSVYENADDGTLRKLKQETSGAATALHIEGAIGGRDYYIRYNVQGHQSVEFLNTAVACDANGRTVLVYDGATVEVANFRAGYVGDDAWANKHKLRVQGVGYEFNMAQFDTFRLYGDFDRVYLTGGQGDDTLKTWCDTDGDKVTLIGDWGAVTLDGSPRELGVYGGNNDTALLGSLDGVSFLRGTITRFQPVVTLTGARFEHTVTGFGDIRVGDYSALLDLPTKGVSDEAMIVPDIQSLRTFHPSQITANLYGSTEDDHLVATVLEETAPGEGPRLDVSFSGKVPRSGDDCSLTLHNLVAAEVYSGGGNDTAELHDSAGKDLFVATPVYASLSGDGYDVRTHDFAAVDAHCTNGGHDVAKLFDSLGNDLFVTTPVYAGLSGDGFRNVAHGFRRVHAYATAGGHDVAKHYDSMGDDFFYADPEHGAMYLPGQYYNCAKHFEAVHAYATAGGHDEAQLHGSAANDFFYFDPVQGALWGDGFYNRAKFFEDVQGLAGEGGEDRAELHDSALDDMLDTGDGWAQLTQLGPDSTGRACGFGFVKVVGTAGTNSKWPDAPLDFALQLDGPWREIARL